MVTCDELDGVFVVTVWTDGGPIARETYVDDVEAERRAALLRKLVRA